MKMKMRSKVGRSFIATIVMIVIAGMHLNAQDWSQWRGPNRDGVYRETGLNLNWAETKPALAWTFRQAGVGYSSPAIVGTTLYCLGAENGQDFVFALDTETGNLKWKQVLGPQYVDGQNRGNGARGSITVDGDRLYFVRGKGEVHCVAAADGRMIWQKEFIRDFGGKLMSDWGFSESLLVDGNFVICTPGGTGGTLVSLDKNSGNLVWRSTGWADDAGYSSPIAADVNGVRQYIQQSSKGVAGISARDGRLLWKVDIAGYRTAVIPSPIYQNNMVYVTSGYGAGCNYIRLTREGDGFKADVVYANTNMTNQHGGVVLMSGHIYGFHDAQGLVCQNLSTGESVWAERQQGLFKGAVLGVNDRLLLQSERGGLLAIVAASPQGWREFGRMEFPERTKIENADNMIWTHPVIANGKLYVRDHDLLFCYKLK
jgi:outer membrane protein assembly factor BamB